MVVEDLARVVYRCRTCEAQTGVREELKHKETCANNFGILKICTKSGTLPHVGNAGKR